MPQDSMTKFIVFLHLDNNTLMQSEACGIGVSRLQLLQMSVAFPGLVKKILMAVVHMTPSSCSADCTLVLFVFRQLCAPVMLLQQS